MNKLTPMWRTRISMCCAIAALAVVVGSGCTITDDTLQFEVDSFISGIGTDCGHISTWDTRNVTELVHTFRQKYTFNDDISGWNLSSVTKLEGTFEEAVSFNGDLAWNLAKVGTMERVFYGANAFNGNISRWNVAGTTTMYEIFYDASIFNSDLSMWDVSRVSSLRGAFRGAKLFNGNISRWNTSAVTTLRSTFRGAESFNQDLSLWDVSSTNELYDTFSTCSNFNGNISTWNVQNVRNIMEAFNGASNFNQDISEWNTEKITDMYGAFIAASSFNSNISQWNVSRVENMAHIFSDASAFNADIATWDVKHVTTLRSSFKNASEFNADIRNWNTGRVTTLQSAFQQTLSFDHDISSWNVVRVSSIEGAFFNAGAISSCSAYNIERSWTLQGAGVSTDEISESFPPSRPPNCTCTLSDANALVYISYLVENDDDGIGCELIGSWDMSRVTTLNDAFLAQSTFNTDITQWNTSKVKSLDQTFLGANSFNQDVSNWNVAKVTSMVEMFGGATSLSPCFKVAIDIAWSENVAYQNTYGDEFRSKAGCESLPGYLSIVKRLECGYGTNQCTCVDLDYAKATRHCHDANCGTIPSTLGECLDVNELVLRTDTTTPPLVGSIPSELGNLLRLTTLDIGEYNALNETIPSELGRLSNLRTLDLGGQNMLLGVLPSELGNLVNLNELDLSGANMLTGPIPSELGLLTNLSKLYLGGSAQRLNGSIPATLGNLSNLVIMDLFGNDLTGTFHASMFSNLSKLEELVLSDNSLESPLADSGILSLEQLTVLALDRNKFSETVPSVNLLRSLRVLLLHRNDFYGTIPVAHFSNNFQLEVVNLGYNRFEGDVPKFADLTRLNQIQLMENQFTRVISGSFANTSGESVLIDLAYQQAFEFSSANSSERLKFDKLELEQRAFENVGANPTIVLTHNKILTIPSHCFDGVSSARLELSDAEIYNLDEYAFANTYNVSIDLSTNYIQTVHPYAFDSAVLSSFFSSSFSTLCENAYGWDATCETMFKAADSLTCNSKVECDDVAIVTFSSEKGSTPREACCAFGGGFRSGTSLVMDSASPITCNAAKNENENIDSISVICTCSDTDSSPKYDLVSFSCVQGCEENYGFFLSETPGDYPLIDSALEIGSCLPCPSDQSSVDGSLTCSECSFFYTLSTHCELPITGILLFGAVGIIAVLLFYAFLRYYQEEQRREKENMRKLRVTLADQTEMESAWKIDWYSLELIDNAEAEGGGPLATGSFGEVWRGELYGTYDVVVKKMFRTKHVDLKCEPEIKFLKRAKHPKIVWFLGCGQIENKPRNNLFIVLEFMNQGDLRDLLWIDRQSCRTPPSWSTRLSLLKDAAEGLCYLHFMLGKMHRDLKSPNILLTKQKKNGRLSAKVGDFGLAKALHGTRERGNPSSSSCCAKRGEGVDSASKEEGENTNERCSATMTSLAGSLLWMAPEVYPHRGEKMLHYDKKIDVYSFGIILWEALELSQPWTHDGTRFQRGPLNSKIMNAVEAGERPPISNEDEAPKGYVSLVKACWDGDPKRRPNFRDVLYRLQDMEAAMRAAHTEHADVRMKAIEIGDTEKSTCPAASGGVELKAIP